VSLAVGVCLDAWHNFQPRWPHAPDASVARIPQTMGGSDEKPYLKGESHDSFNRESLFTFEIYCKN